MQGVEPPRWASAHRIELAHKLNEQAVSMLCKLVSLDSHQGSPDFVEQNRELWRRLDSEAIRSLSEFPFVLLDLGFGETEYWSNAGSVAPAVGTGGSSALFPAEVSGDLMLETLLLARQTAREDMSAVKVLFGATDVVAHRLASLTMQQVRDIALHDVHRLRVRFDDKPQFWRELLVAARGTDRAVLAGLHHHAKLLFTGEVAPAQTGKQRPP